MAPWTAAQKAATSVVKRVGMRGQPKADWTAVDSVAWLVGQLVKTMAEKMAALLVGV